MAEFSVPGLILGIILVLAITYWPTVVLAGLGIAFVASLMLDRGTTLFGALFYLWFVYWCATVVAWFVSCATSCRYNPAIFF